MKRTVVILAALTLVASGFGVAVRADVKRNDIPGDIFIGNQRVMRLAPTRGKTLGERVAQVYRRLVVLQSNQPVFDPEQIESVSAFIIPEPKPEWYGQERVGWKDFAEWFAKGKANRTVMVGYVRWVDFDPPLRYEGDVEHIYGYFPDNEKRPKWAVLKVVVIPIVTVTAEDAKLHGTDVYKLADQWASNIIAAFDILKR